MNFIEIYDNVLSKKECERLIHLFEDSPLKDEGVAGGRVNHSAKQSIALDLSFGEKSVEDPDNKEVNEIFANVLRDNVDKYKKKYYYLNDLPIWCNDDSYHIQKFEEGGGYHAIHCEHEPTTPFRMLVWMFYLNNAKCGTRFYYQDKTIRAKQGRLVIWPAFWTHMHSGVTPNKGDKYVMSGWYSFDYKDQPFLQPYFYPD